MEERERKSGDKMMNKQENLMRWLREEGDREREVTFTGSRGSGN